MQAASDADADANSNSDSDSRPDLASSTDSDIKLSDFKLLTAEAVGELKALLQHITSKQGTIFAILIDKDGEIVTSLIDENELEALSLPIEAIAKLAINIFLDANTAALDISSASSLHQVFLALGMGHEYLTICDFGGGYLAVLSRKAPDTQKSETYPWFPGDPPEFWPPRSEPPDPSRSPLGKTPSGRAGEIALPLPPPG